GELPLGVEQALGEAEAQVEDLTRLGQVLGVGDRGDRGQRRRDLGDVVAPGLDGLDGGVLALADEVEDLVLDGAGLLGGGSHGKTPWWCGGGCPLLRSGCGHVSIDAANYT